MHISLQHRRSRFSGSEEVTRQRNVINVLTQRLSFMMSMFGIDDGVLLNDDRNADGGGSVSEVKISRGNATSGNATNTANSVLSPKDSFQSAVLSAVCVEQQKQESRAKNFVVSGLPVGSNDDVKKAIDQLCEKELNMQPCIRSCRQLGRRVEGKVQPILVSLHTVDEAASVISKAKQLRNSADPLVKRQVYINPDLTKAQSAAAYELRCQRRKARDRENQRLQIVRTDQHHGSASDSTHSSSRFKNSTVPAGALSATASAFFSS